MRIVGKISLLICLFGQLVGIQNSGYAAEIQPADVVSHNSEAAQLAVPSFPLFVVELQLETLAEVEPESAHGIYAYPAKVPGNIGSEYLHIVRKIQISPSSSELLFPFHSHL